MHNFLWQTIKNPSHSFPFKLFFLFLFPLSCLYRLAGMIIQSLHHFRILPVFRASRPVISIGNIAVGGTGKTPFIIWLAKYLLNQRKSPVIVTRGYMPDKTAKSDEARMLVKELPQVPVYVSPDRAGSMQKAVSGQGVDVFLMDDGFQHWRCARDLDIVLVDMLDPLGNGYVLPCGILREPFSALSRADVIVLTRCDLAPDNVAKIRHQIARSFPQVLLVETGCSPIGVEDVFLDNDELLDIALVRGRVFACSAIGSPDGFERTLKTCGAEIVRYEIFMDHHVYTEKDVQKLVNLCRIKKVDVLVVTRKDAVKLKQFSALFSGISVYALVISVVFLRGEHAFLSRLDRLLSS